MFLYILGFKYISFVLAYSVCTVSYYYFLIDEMLIKRKYRTPISSYFINNNDVQ